MEPRKSVAPLCFFMLTCVVIFMSNLVLHSQGVNEIEHDKPGHRSVEKSNNYSGRENNTGNNSGVLCSEPDVTYVILFTNKRSGSSLTGRSLGNNPNVYYVFEPLHGFKDHYTNTVRGLQFKEKESRKVVNAIEAVLACDFNRYKSIITSPVTQHLSPHLKGFRDCIKNRTNGLQDCIRVAEGICRKFKSRATKVIRATMEEIAILLRENKECSDRIKIIHLLRDPRGKANSHLNLKKEPYQENPEKIKNFADRFCPRILQDIAVKKDLKLTYPNSFLEVHYEDIANDLVPNIEAIYDFVWKEKPPIEITNWMEVIRNGSSKGHYDSYNLVRKNSSQTASQWKTELDKDLLKHIEHSCKDLIEYLKLDFIHKLN